jgi:hypothetical protein
MNLKANKQGQEVLSSIKVETERAIEQVIEVPNADNPEQKIQVGIRLTPKKDSGTHELHADTHLAQEIQIGQEFFVVEMGRTHII